MKRFLFTLLLINCFGRVFGQVPESAMLLYDKGVEYFNSGEYAIADSLFSKAIDIYSWPAPYYNKASISYRRNDLKSYCVNLKMAADLGDNRSQKNYLIKCTSTDTVYRTIDSLVCTKEESAFYEVIKVSPYLYQMTYAKYVNDSMITGYSIDKRDTTYTIFKDIEMPVFPGGEEGLVKYLSENIKYPKYSRDHGDTGKVFVTFVINTDGKVIETRILRGVSIEIDNEALRVVNNMPIWKPGMKDGFPVKVQYNLPMNFTLR